MLFWAALASLAVWAGLLAFRGGFWRADQRLAPAGTLGHWPAVAAVMPARDEAETIGRAVRSLLSQDYPGEFRVVVIDDGSADGTADVARNAADGDGRLTVVPGTPLEPGWTGKLWAMSQGFRAVETMLPDAAFVLLTDADVTHPSGGVRRLVFAAETGRRDLVSVMVKLHCRSTWERLLVPAFVFFFQKLYPFAWINDPAKSTAGAAGGCMLVRRTALDEAGGVAAIRDRVIDDCALAALLKRKGAIWLGLAEDFHSLRRYERLADFWTMVARTAFVQLGYSVMATFATVVAMAVIYVMPPLGVVAGLAMADWTLIVLGAVAWALMGVAYIPTLRYYGRGPVSALALPAAALLYTAMTVDSMVQYEFRRGAPWKGRRYDRTGHGRG
jgi:hopene-associated glycosyltransferase HpnB